MQHLRRMLNLLGLLVVMLLVVPGIPAAAVDEEEPPVSPPPDEASKPCGLVTTTHTSLAFAGSCTTPDGTLRTQFKSTTSGSSTRATLSVSTGRTISATRSTNEAIITFSGGAIDLNTLYAIRGLGEKLEQDFTSLTPTDADDVAMRLIAFVGDLHVGYNEAKIVAVRPTEAVAPIDISNDEVVRTAMSAVVVGLPTAAARQLCASTFSTLSPTFVAAACQQNGGNGINYISCADTRKYTHHDASNHCYTRYRIAAGPCTSNCRGRCGRGCALGGRKRGAYTKDCLDHDYCEAGHSSGSCNDEANEAADDFLFAKQWSCDGCNNPS